MSTAAVDHDSAAVELAGAGHPDRGPVALALFRAARALRLSAPQLGYSEWSALATLCEHGPMTLARLAGAEGISPPAMSRTVESLRRAQLTTRGRDPHDSRLILLSATPAGHTVCGDQLPPRVAAILHTLDPDETAIVLRTAAALITELLTTHPDDAAAVASPSTRSDAGEQGVHP